MSTAGSTARSASSSADESAPPDAATMSGPGAVLRPAVARPRRTAASNSRRTRAGLRLVGEVTLPPATDVTRLRRCAGCGDEDRLVARQRQTLIARHLHDEIVALHP